MQPILFIALTTGACAMAHYSIVFLEPEKASFLKAVAFNALLVVGSNIARSAGFNPEPLLEWTVYLLLAAGLVWALYKLKPINTITVGACYVAGSYALAHAASFGANTFTG